jgi:hypothetical protein
MASLPTWTTFSPAPRRLPTPLGSTRRVQLGRPDAEVLCHVKITIRRSARSGEGEQATLWPGRSSNRTGLTPDAAGYCCHER